MVTTLSALMALVLLAGPGEPVPVDDAFAAVTSPEDVHTAVMKATVRLSIPLSDPPGQSGTGFFVWKMGANGRKRVFLVTAAHALASSKWALNLYPRGRLRASGAKCGTDQWELPTRDREQKPLWLENKEADVAVLEVSNARVACVAISVGDLATRADVGPLRLGDEVFTVGYPLGLASSSEEEGDYGFLRVGRVAGYPVVTKAHSAPGMIFDASVSEGFSGAPLYWVRGSSGGGAKGAVRPRPVVVGVVTMAVQALGEGNYSKSLEAGFAPLAAFARELIENAK